MKINVVAPVMIIALILSAGPVAMAAESVGGVGGDGNTNIDGSTGSAATVGGGGASFAGPAGTDTPPGIVTALTMLVQKRNAGSGPVAVDAPGLRGQKPGVTGRSGSGAGPRKGTQSP